jgi:hypothetical protein
MLLDGHTFLVRNRFSHPTLNDLALSPHPSITLAVIFLSGVDDFQISLSVSIYSMWMGSTKGSGDGGEARYFMSLTPSPT